MAILDLSKAEGLGNGAS